MRVAEEVAVVGGVVPFGGEDGGGGRGGFGDALGGLAVAEAGEAEADGDHAGVGEEGEGVVGVAEVLGGVGGEGGGHVFGDVEGGEDVAAVDGFGHNGGALCSRLDVKVRELVEQRNILSDSALRCLMTMRGRLAYAAGA